MNAVIATIWACSAMLCFADDEPMIGFMFLAIAGMYLSQQSYRNQGDSDETP